MYLPTARLLIMKLPSPFVVAVFFVPLASTATTDAPTITPPNSSETCPLIVPVACCPKAPTLTDNINKMPPNTAAHWRRRLSRNVCICGLRRGGPGFGYIKVELLRPQTRQ